MKVFNISYETTDRNAFRVGVLDETKEKALNYLHRAMKGRVGRVNSISAGNDVHAISDELVSRIAKNSPEYKELQERNKRLNNAAIDYENEIEDLNNRLAMSEERDPRVEKFMDAPPEPQVVVSKVYVCEHCGKECETVTGLKQHKTKMHS